MKIEFQLNAAGQIETKPLVGYRLSPLGNMFGILAVQYQDRPDEPETPDTYPQLQIALTAAQVRDLAEDLHQLANWLLSPHGEPKQ